MNHIGRILLTGRSRREALNEEINLAHLEASSLQTEIEIKIRQFLELLGKETIIPGGILGEPIVRDQEGAGLGLGQVLKTDGRHLSDAQKLASLKPPMAGDDLRFSIDENRNIKAEGFDAAGDLLDLLRRATEGFLDRA